MLDSYPRSYYNDAYFWPELKVHWRRKDNSPLVGFSQGRCLGGGSSVMGMVAYRGTPDDYAEWQALGAAGWGWDDVLPYYRKLESDLDFDGALHGKDGPVPIRRTKDGGLGAAGEGGARFRAGTANSVCRRHECRFPRRLWRRADEQLAGQARFGGDLLSHGRGAPPRQSDHCRRCHGDRAVCSRAAARAASRPRSAAKRGIFRGREIIVALGGIHSPAFLMRAGIGLAPSLARPRRRGPCRSSRCRTKPVQSRHPLHRFAAESPARGSPQTSGRIR